ncbi:MAG: U32 family peptidase [Firmicutes bacterium]|nr:U32 family peptidase [Bacillota bacterium]
MKEIELLAPVGNMDSLIGAINAGADAVYLAGKQFGARRYAENFSEDEIDFIINYAHIRQVKVYVTINTLIYDDEISSLFSFTDFLVDHFVDALIIQDIGIMNEMIQRYPDTDIHASTQVNTFSFDQAKFLKDLGVKRIILARETSIATIKEIKNNLDIELEVFIHGALCVSYSGNCLFSSMNGGRSGNRGECAQPCRQKYQLVKNNENIGDQEYLLSNKDLMTIEYISEIINSGVTSLKIEGRMRKSDYVITTVLAYRAAINSHFDSKSSFNIESNIKDLNLVFNRMNTKGYILNENPNNINNSFRPNHIGVEVGVVQSYDRGKTTILLSDRLQVGDGIRILGKYDTGDRVSKIMKNGVSESVAYRSDIIIIDLAKEVEKDSIVVKTMDLDLVNSTKKYLNPNYKLLSLKGKLKALIGSPLSVTIEFQNDKPVIFNAEYIVQKALNNSTEKVNIERQMNKLGETPFYFETLSFELDENIFIPTHILSDLRREVIKSTIEKLIYRNSRIKKTRLLSKNSNLNLDSFQLSVKVETMDQFLIAISKGIKTIYYSEKIKYNFLEVKSTKFVKILDRISPNLEIISDSENLLIQNLGQLKIVKKNMIDSNFFINVTNFYTLKLLHDLQIHSVTLSPELQKHQIEELIDAYTKQFYELPNVTVVGYGKIDLMISKHCPISSVEVQNSKTCSLCDGNNYGLKDHFGNIYPIVKERNCHVRILHSHALNLIEYVNFFKLVGVSNLRLDFTTESKKETSEIIDAFLNSINDEDFKMPNLLYTYGRFVK